MSPELAQNLLSGLVGAVLTQVAVVVMDAVRRRRQYRALLNGIVAECDYNLSIVDEILNGAVDHKGSFKRMSVDFFRSAREGAVKYSMDRNLISTLSRTIIDLELFNLEVNYIFSGDENRFIYAGAIDEKPILVERRPKEYDITNTITHARLGVTNTLNDLKKLANAALQGDEE